MIKGMQEVSYAVEQVKDAFSKREGGLNTICFVACGGSLGASYPARYMLNAESRTLRILGMNSSEFVQATPKCIGENSLVIGISTKATPETVAALKVASGAGAATIALTGYEESATAQAAQHALIYPSSSLPAWRMFASTL